MFETIFPQYLLIFTHSDDPDLTVHALEAISDEAFDAWLRDVIQREEVNSIYLLSAYRGLAAAQWSGRRYWVINALAESGARLAHYLLTTKQEICNGAI